LLKSCSHRGDFRRRVALPSAPRTTVVASESGDSTDNPYGVPPAIRSHHTILSADSESDLLLRQSKMRRVERSTCSRSAERDASEDMRHIAPNAGSDGRPNVVDARYGVPWSLVRPRTCSSCCLERSFHRPTPVREHPSQDCSMAFAIESDRGVRYSKQCRTSAHCGDHLGERDSRRRAIPLRGCWSLKLEDFSFSVGLETSLSSRYKSKPVGGLG
jgi:hypothetical protein